MEPIQAGILSILPPLIAIVLALVTKEVIFSLVIGILSGTFIYSFSTGGGFVGGIYGASEMMITKLSDSANASIIVFLAILGALVAVITMAGGSRAYGDWASKKLKNRTQSQLATAFLGCLIFVDDYFNCLTVGTVMRPVTDRFKVSRAKLSYLIDSTAAPICIIAPISSWAASVISQMEGTGLNGMQAFIQSIPYNLYAILTIIMVVVVCCTRKCDFGPMAHFERNAIEKGDLHSNANGEAAGDDLAEITPSEKGRVFDLVIPIIALIIFSVLAMLYVGAINIAKEAGSTSIDSAITLFKGYFDGSVTIANGFGNTSAGNAMALGGIGALIVAFLLFVPRKVLSFKEFLKGIGIGVKSMVPAYIILTLAWTISGVCRDMLSTGDYVAGLVESSNMPVAIIPAAIFIIAGLLSFSTGTSWGTFGILIPIIATVCQSVAPHLMVVSLAAVLAGSILGDHSSPISDTTILSSTGGGCNHIDHVSTQLPYVLTVGVCCVIGYLVAGFTANVWATLGTGVVLLAIALLVLPRLWKGKEKVAK